MQKGNCHTKETIEKMRKAKEEKNNPNFGKDLSGKNNPHYGKCHSKETKEKISKALKDKQFTEAHKLKISEAISGVNHPMFGKYHLKETIDKMKKAQSGENNPMYGKYHTKESKEKMSEAHKVIQFTEEHNRNISLNHADVSGESNPNWQGGISFFVLLSKIQ